MHYQKQMSETFILGAILSMVGGFLDAYTYLCRGSVFANAQTGNIVLLGIKLAQRHWLQSLYYVIPILSFCLGVLVTERIKYRYREHTLLHWRQIIIVFEILVLMVAAFFPGGKCNMAVNCLISFVCSLQVQSFHSLKGKAYATTMCTGNLRSATELLHASLMGKDKSKLWDSLSYFGIVAFFILGAVISTLLIQIFSVLSLLFACVLLCVAFVMMFQSSGKGLVIT